RIGKSCLPCCAVPAERILADNAYALAVADAFPVSPGHTLVILRRHAISFFELSAEELAAIYDLLRRMKDELTNTNPSEWIQHWRQ
ncbi:MAG TPA: HIT family protein, partial [Gemmataceae bacterium]|nr:HIT family protein [Gemmataceae bacterium]